MKLEIDRLEGTLVRLERFHPRLREELRAALDCDGEAWALVARRSAQGKHFGGWWDDVIAAGAQGQRIAFAIRLRASGRVVGTSGYVRPSEPDRKVEIGGTFLSPPARGGPVNAETKLLLLDHAFRAGAMRVQFQTDARNLRSQAALAKIGATREGTLRQDTITWTGHVRDSVIFSILRSEWPEVRNNLLRLLEAATLSLPRPC